MKFHLKLRSTASLEEEEAAGGGGGLWEESESLATRVSNPSVGGGGGFWEESESLATRVSAAGFSNHSGGGDDNGGGSSSNKRTKTRFTQDQKDKMMEFAQRLGWRMKKQNEDLVQQFCDEIGVKRHALKVWMYNTKHTLTRVSSDGSSSKKRFKSKFTPEQTDKMLEFGKRLGWRILKQDEDAVKQFCEETIGVNPQVLKAWVYNKRYTHGYSSQEGRPDSQSKVKKVETRKRRLEAEAKRCSEESKFGQTMNCHDLSMKLENKKMECIAVQDKYRDGLKEWISCLEDQKVVAERGKRAQERIPSLHTTPRLEDDKKVIFEREKRAQERIPYSAEELGKPGRGEMEKYVLIKTDSRDFEFSKRRAEDEIEVCKKRFMLFGDPSFEDGRRTFNFQM